MLTQIVCKIAGYGSYGRPGEPLIYERGAHAGQAVEYVDVVQETESGPELRRLTLSPTINGDRPETGSDVVMVASIRKGRGQVLFRRDERSGNFRDFIHEPDKWRAERFTPAPTGK